MLDTTSPTNSRYTIFFNEHHPSPKANIALNMAMSARNDVERSKERIYTEADRKQTCKLQSSGRTTFAPMVDRIFWKPFQVNLRPRRHWPYQIWTRGWLVLIQSWNPGILTGLDIVDPLPCWQLFATPGIIKTLNGWNVVISFLRSVHLHMGHLTSKGSMTLLSNPISTTMSDHIQ